MNSNSSRDAVISALADAVSELPQDRPVRVAVNGRIASGKTTLACELVDRLIARGRVARQIGVDGFHNPRAVRYRQGRESARGYYEDAYDLATFKEYVLEPLGRPLRATQDHWLIRTRSLDLVTDTPEHPEPEAVGAGELIIVDGSFLLVPSLRGFWDYTIFLDVDRDIAAGRGARRDAAHLNGLEEAARLHDERYQAACDIYLTENEPEHHADAVVDNRDIKHPKIRRLGAMR